MISVVSANGPAVTVRFEPENRTRAPRELGISPVPSIRIPALINSSLNFSMAANISAGGISPASDAFVALPITMTFMTNLLNLLDGDTIEVGHIPTFTSSQTRNSPIDNNLQNLARNLLPTHSALEIAVRN